MAKKISQLEQLDTPTGDESLVAAYGGKNYKIAIKSLTYAINRESLGLDQIDNTPDRLKPVSEHQQRALNEKADKAALDEVSRLVGEKAPSIHGHSVDHISGLPEALAKKAEGIHKHEITDVNGLAERFATINSNYNELSSIQLPAIRQDVVRIANAVNSIIIPTTWDIGSITGLTQALNNKAEALHSHSVQQIQGLDERIAQVSQTLKAIPVTTSDW